jgi:nicotinate-nucleotide adenylyltransferase
MRRIAFFGGTFDPPHRGHLAIAKAAADRFALDEILFAPVASQPLKPAVQPTPFAHRYAMTVLATQADPRFVPSLLDAPRNGHPNYTVETLERLRNSLSAMPEPTELFTLLGADSWLDIARWHNAPRLLALTDWIVAARPGFSLEAAGQALPPQLTAEQVAPSEESLLLRHPNSQPTHVFFMPSLHEDISATELRQAIEATSRAEKDLLPESVQEYIRKTNLYRLK